ncbi:MAG: tRNA (adenosine(37)-N6)-threonylcarbamoyltransferase complex transferase subunit TsaD [Pseudomonadota bacterium]
MTILGIETSCDETAAAIVTRTEGGAASREPDIVAQAACLVNIVRSQWSAHAPYGGVVPEIAARAHCEVLDRIIADAMTSASISADDIDAVAVTAGPGLIGGLIVGITTATMLGLAWDKPVIGINHLEGHALTVGLSNQLAPPYLLLLVSGGHSQIVLVEAVGLYRRVGTTVDDALGEAFDKTAKILGLPQPGGPAVEAAARLGDAARFKFPRPMLGRPEPNFSFAGLKTAVRQQAQKLAPLSDQDVADLCAGFQAAVAETLVDRMRTALRDVVTTTSPADVPERQLPMVIAGGVAANKVLRAALVDLAARDDRQVHLPPLSLCGDNAAMIAWAAAERLAAGLDNPQPIVARPRWPLDEISAPVVGHGRKGAKV